MQLVINSLVLACIYILIAIGLTIIYGVLRLIHVAHGAIYILGAYATVLFFGLTGNLIFSVLLACLSSALSGICILYFVYRPLMQAPRLIPLVASIGAYYFAWDAFRHFFGPAPLTFPRPISSPSIIPYFVFTSIQFYIVLVAALSVIILWFFLVKTKVGLALRAVAQDAGMASALGINRGRMIMLAFFLGSALAGMGGSLVAVHYNYAFRSMGDEAIAAGLAIIVLGGMGSVPGTLLAAIIVAAVQTITQVALPTLLPPFTVAFLVLIVILILRPTGIAGRTVW